MRQVLRSDRGTVSHEVIMQYVLLVLLAFAFLGTVAYGTATGDWGLKGLLESDVATAGHATIKAQDGDIIVLAPGARVTVTGR